MHRVQALTKFLKSVNWKVPQEAKQALDLLNKWSPMDVDDALELLSPSFINPAVRKYAVTRLQQADDEVRHCSKLRALRLSSGKHTHHTEPCDKS